MDPVTALALAGNVLQFVGFSAKLLQNVRQILKTGELDSNAESARLAQDIHSLTTDIVDQCTAFKAKLTPALPPSGSVGKQESNDPLLKACADCQVVASLIQTKVESTKLPTNSKAGSRIMRKWRRAKSTMLQLWSQEELKRLTSELDNAKQAVERRVLVSLSSKIDFLILEQSEKFARLGDENKAIVTSLLKNQDAAFHSLTSQVNALSFLLNRIEISIADQNRANHKIITDILAAAESVSLKQMHPEIASAAAEESNVRRTVALKILSSLKFASIKSRFEAVDEAHQETFKWIFQSPIDQESHMNGRIWSDFSSWLSSGNGIYWINGKPASGKSTLMKHIISDAATPRLLTQWVSCFPEGTKLCMAKFFFWQSGTKDQRTQQGLLRSILHEICSSFPHLIPVAFPGEWSRRYYELVRPDKHEGQDWGLETSELTVSWSLKELKDAATRLMSQTQYPMQICMFVDGLDEFEGDETEIARLFSQFCKSPNVKCCVSSRPHQPFIDAFRGQPSLRLQDFTHRDIVRYVSEQLNGDERWERVAKEDLKKSQELTMEIVESAKGVFLWVKLVVGSLLRGLGNWDTIVDLQQRLRKIPKELEGLYEQMIFKVDEVYQQDSMKFFRCAHEVSELSGPLGELTILQMVFACKTYENLASAVELSKRYSSKKWIEQACQDMAKRIVTRCGGLLEIQHQPSMHEVTPGLKVSYLHATVKDYLQGRQSALQARLSPGSLSRFRALHGITVAYILYLGLDLNQIMLPPQHSSRDLILNLLCSLHKLQNDAGIPRDEYIALCDKALGMIEGLWKQDRPHDAIAIEHRLHIYLRHVLSDDRNRGIDRSPKAMYIRFETAIFSRSFDDAPTMEVLLEFGVKFGADISQAWTRWINFHTHEDWAQAEQSREIIRLFIRYGARVELGDFLRLRRKIPRTMWTEIEADPVIRQHLEVFSQDDVAETCTLPEPPEAGPTPSPPQLVSNKVIEDEYSQEGA